MLARRKFIQVAGGASAVVGSASSTAMTSLFWDADKKEGGSFFSAPPSFRKKNHEVKASKEEVAYIHGICKKLAALQRYVGHGRFNVLSFDGMLRYGRFQKKLAWDEAEIGWIEDLFNHDANDFGFYGEKVSDKLTMDIPNRQIKKIAGSGHYLYRADSIRLYEQIRKQIGHNVVLTSGVRSHVKQLYLFLSQVLLEKGSFSKAAHKLAPPGYSYHGVGDFDVGKVGFGARNFTSAFAATDEYKRLVDSGFVVIRYPHGNPFGVRFEPWHIKVAS